MRSADPGELDYFRFGYAVDTARMRTVLGFEPRWTTMQAFDDFIRGAALRPVIKPDWIDAAEAGLLRLVGANPVQMKNTAAKAGTR